jgi:hypothetical protein
MPLFKESDIDDVFTYHAWTHDQVRLGGDVRRAAKELARAILRSRWAEAQTDLSYDCRDRALTYVRLAVQEANAAITFEREPRIENTIGPASVSCEQAAPREKTSEFWTNAESQYQGKPMPKAEKDG